jgi:glycine cleavage system aminomethyltransferase T
MSVRFEISPTTRLRRSPFFEATVAEGVTGFYPYNSMLMPTGYGDPEAEYWRLINGVSMWDVAVERQVELAGPDAGVLAQILCPRDLTNCKIGQGKYVALCNHDGVIINDPILLKLDDTRYWLSIADNNIVLFARAIAAERGLNVRVFEPDVSPLAVQGPMAEKVIASIFGDWIRDLKYFWFGETEIDEIPVQIARSGWSKQGGFEIYLMDGTKASQLWNIVREAGKPWGIGPGNPNMCERIESALISYGSDTDDQTNPFEIRMGRYVDTGVPDDTIGIQTLRKIEAEGPKRHQLGVVLQGSSPEPVVAEWAGVERDGKSIGSLTSGVWSRRLERNIGLVLVDIEAQIGDAVTVHKNAGSTTGQLVALPFI